MFTVKDALEFLQGADPERVLVMSKDGEGNTYSPLSSITETRYKPENTWSGEIDDPDEPFDENDKTVVNALVLWPTN
jgi:hypothetical protein